MDVNKNVQWGIEYLVEVDLVSKNWNLVFVDY